MDGIQQSHHSWEQLQPFQRQQPEGAGKIRNCPLVCLHPGIPVKCAKHRPNINFRLRALGQLQPFLFFQCLHALLIFLTQYPRLIMNALHSQIPAARTPERGLPLLGADVHQRAI